MSARPSSATRGGGGGGSGRPGAARALPGQYAVRGGPPCHRLPPSRRSRSDFAVAPPPWPTRFTPTLVNPAPSAAPLPTWRRCAKMRRGMGVHVARYNTLALEARRRGLRRHSETLGARWRRHRPARESAAPFGLLGVRGSRARARLPFRLHSWTWPTLRGGPPGRWPCTPHAQGERPACWKAAALTLPRPLLRLVSSHRLLNTPLPLAIACAPQE